jgi:hypothetical protein
MGESIVTIDLGRRYGRAGVVRFAQEGPRGEDAPVPATQPAQIRAALRYFAREDQQPCISI